ncbi:MAG: insulinase family protein, partial [Gemmatimonadetes bacterium]|nr:insulinase family protein [Gemmatimonadota bacterium]
MGAPRRDPRAARRGTGHGLAVGDQQRVREGSDGGHGAHLDHARGRRVPALGAHEPGCRPVVHCLRAQHGAPFGEGPAKLAHVGLAPGSHAADAADAEARVCEGPALCRAADPVGTRRVRDRLRRCRIRHRRHLAAAPLAGAMTARAPCGAAFHGANALDDVLPPATVVSHRLTNGLRVLARRKPGCGVVAIATYVGAGYFDETDDIVGIAHVLEHMYFKGTPTRGVGEIARETKAAGGVLNAATIYDHTHYYAVLPAAAFEAGLAIQADAYANSLIDQGELSRELEVIIEEAKRKADSPTAVATESLFELMHDVHRVRRWRIGREPGLRALRREHVYAFYRRLYRPGNSVIAIVGDVDPDAVVRAVESRYGHLTDGDVMRDRGAAEPARAGEFRYRELDGDVQQSELVIGWRTPGVAHADSPALDMAAALLAAGRSSRLYQAVRDRQLASSMQAWNYTPGEIGMFVLHARAKPETAPRAMGAAWAQLAHLRDGDASEAELARTRVTLYADAVRRLETAEGQAHHLGWWELNGGWRNGGEYLARELAADRTAVANAASRW